MRKKILLFFLLFFVGIEVIFSAPYNCIVELDSDTLYNRTISYLQEEGYFVECVDSGTGFIKVKRYEESTKLFSSLAGRLFEINMFVRPVAENRSEISVSIYITKYYNSSETLFHKEGLCDDTALYESVIAGIKNGVAGD